jgi:hypothetical protein
MVASNKIWKRKGSFAAALIQFGYTTRDGMRPVDPSIRNAYKDLLDNEQAVRQWWDTKVPENKKNLWLSARAIHRNWKNFVNPKPKKPRQRWGRIIEGRALTEEEIRERSTIKPSKEAMEAKQRAEAEAEAKRLEGEQPDVSAERRALENEVADLRAENETLKAGLATPTVANGQPRAGIGASGRNPGPCQRPCQSDRQMAGQDDQRQARARCEGPDCDAQAAARSA